MCVCCTEQAELQDRQRGQTDRQTGLAAQSPALWQERTELCFLQAASLPVCEQQGDRQLRLLLATLFLPLPLDRPGCQRETWEKSSSQPGHTDRQVGGHIEAPTGRQGGTEKPPQTPRAAQRSLVCKNSKKKPGFLGHFQAYFSVYRTSPPRHAGRCSSFQWDFVAGFFWAF